MKLASGRVTLIGVLLALQLSAVAAAFLLFSGDETGLTPLAEAAHRTSEYPGARMTIDARLEVPGEGTALTMDGRGEYNGTTGLSRIVFDVDPPPGVPVRVPGGRMQLEQLAEEQPGLVVVYWRSLALGQLPGGAQWMKVDLSEFVDAQAQSFDPRDQLEMLRSSEDFERLGSEPVRGVPATRYRATIDYRAEVERLRDEGQDTAAEALEKYIALEGGVDTEPVEAWVARDKTIRRLRFEMPSSMGVWPKGTTALVNVELYDFGIEPQIELPAGRTVFDGTEIARQGLESLPD
jgi:hypothetical protein